MSNGDGFYVIGGTLPVESESYIVRKADTDLLDALRLGQYCYVLNTRQMGKSSLMVRAARTLTSEGNRVIVLDLSAIGQNLTVDQWYFGILTRIAFQLDCQEQVSSFWKANRDIGPMQRFVEALRIMTVQDRVNQSGRFIIFIDEIDAVLSLSFSADEFFAGIRECYNRRTHDESFKRITFCLLGVATPADLIQDTRTSPFNIGTRIELLDFTTQEAAPLTHGLVPDGPVSGLLRRALDRILHRVLYWTDGHPYMTQRLCKAAAESVSLNSALSKREVDRLVDAECERLFLSRNARETDDNLAFVRNRMLMSQADVASILDQYGRVRAGKRVLDDETNPLCSVLALAGISRALNGRLSVRNRIYRSVFDAAWVCDHMPGEELRRQRLAYRRGAMRTAAISALMIAVTAGLAGIAVNQANVARQAFKTADERLSRADVDAGNRLMENGDDSGALAPLAEAFSIDANDARKTEVHRQRLGIALSRCPSIERIWFSSAPMTCLEYSPDRRLFCFAGEDGTAHVFTTESLKEIPLTIRHSGAIVSVCFSPDTSKIITCGADACARIWDIPGRKLLATIHHQPRPDGQNAVTKACWSRDGRLVATCGVGIYAVWAVSGPDNLQQTSAEAPRPEYTDTRADYGARLVQKGMDEPRAEWAALAFSLEGNSITLGAPNYIGGTVSVPDGKVIQMLKSKEGLASYGAVSIDYSRDGKSLLVAGSFGGANELPGGGIIRLAGVEARERVITGFTPLRMSEAATCGKLCNTEKLVALGSRDHTARIWNVLSQAPVTPPLQHAGRVNSVDFSPDDALLVTGSADNSARVWSAATGKLICAPMHHAGPVVSARFARDGEHILTASQDGTMRLWRLPTKPYVQLAKGRCWDITSCSPSDESLLVSMGDSANAKMINKTIFIIDAHTGRRLCPAPGFEPSFSWAATDSALKRVLFTHSDDPPAKCSQVWSLETGKPLWSPPITARSSQISANGQVLLIQEESGQYCIFDASSGKKRFPLFHMRGRRVQLLNPEHGRRPLVLCQTTTRTFTIIDAQSGVQIVPTFIHRTAVVDTRVSDDGEFIFFLTFDGYLQVWRTRDGTLVGKASGFDIGSYSATFSTDGTLALTTCVSGAKLWHLKSRGLSTCQSIGSGIVNSAVISDDNQYLFLGDNIQWLWRLSSGRAVLLNVPAIKVHRVWFDKGHQRMATVYPDGTSQFWNLRKVQPTSPHLEQAGTVDSVCFMRDRDIAVTGAGKGEFRLWDTDTGAAVSPVLRGAGGSPWPLTLAHDQKRLFTAGELDARVWDVSTADDPADRLQARCKLLSGSKMDAQFGPMPVSQAELKRAWMLVESSTHR